MAQHAPAVMPAKPQTRVGAALCTLVALLCLASLAVAAAPKPAAQPDIAALERQFRAPAMAQRRLLGPLFWLHGDESAARLRAYVGKVAEGGNGCFTVESRPHNDWLGPGWWRDLRICLDEAKRRGLQMWIFDEKWWPSGEVAGKVPERYAAKRLRASDVLVGGPGPVSANLGDQARIVAVLAAHGSPSGIDASSLIDLTARVHDGRLRADLPAWTGTWHLMVLRWEPVRSGSRYLVDGASRDCVDWYIRTVYQPHYDRFKADFGKTIRGFFYDEPETPGDWGTEVRAILAERGIDWKAAFAAWAFRPGAAAASPVEKPLVLAGEEWASARYQYQDAFAEAWGRTMYGGITRWCRAHGVKSMGHFLEHANCYLNPGLCAGNMVQLMKYSDMGAIDAVFAQFVMGKRVANDAPCWQTPKLGSSISHAYGKPDDVTMVEIFGARGQDLTYPEMKWWADHMQVSGVNFLIPHSFNPRSPYDTDCPPYFYNGGYEPRWPLYRVFADYSSRLSLMLAGGRHVCPVALLYLGNSAHVGRYVTPEQMSEALQDALYDCDWIPYDVLERDTAVAGRRLRLRQEQYRVLVVPPVEVIPYATLAKVKAFYDAGGTVVGYGFLPSRSATPGRSAEEVARLRTAVWGEARPGLGVCRANGAGGRSYLLPERPTPEQLQRVLAGDAGVHPTLEVVEGRTDHWLHVLHRVKAGRDVFFVANQNHIGPARRFRVRVTAEGVPECWDAMRGAVCSAPFTRRGRRVDVTLTLEANESTLLVFQPSRRRLAPREAPAPVVAIPVTRDPVAPTVMPPLRDSAAARRLGGCSWVWYPEGNPAAGVAPGARFFRKRLSLAPGSKPTRATFYGTCDNGFTLYVNGKEAGKGGDLAGEGWRAPVEIDVAALLHPGENVLAIRAVNGGTSPNPAGLIGCLAAQQADGSSQVVPVDGTWRTAREAPTGWAEEGFDDSGWPAARTVVPFGSGPWGMLNAPVTLSPAKDDTLVGHVVVPASALRSGSRVYLEAADVQPEGAARVAVNGRDAGGFIGRPYRLDVTRLVRAGRNTLRVAPFAPTGLRLVVHRP